MNILYIQINDWYCWTLRPYLNEWMLFGVWTSYGIRSYGMRWRGKQW